MVGKNKGTTPGEEVPPEAGGDKMASATKIEMAISSAHQRIGRNFAPLISDVAAKGTHEEANPENPTAKQQAITTAVARWKRRVGQNLSVLKPNEETTKER